MTSTMPQTSLASERQSKRFDVSAMSRPASLNPRASGRGSFEQHRQRAHPRSHEYGSAISCARSRFRNSSRTKANVEPTGLLADVGCGDFGQEQTAATVGGYEGDGRGVGGVERHEACDTWDASVNVGYGPGDMPQR